jgi:hypothetical protein
MHNLLSGEWVAPGVVDTKVGRLNVGGQIEDRAEGPVTVLIRPEAAAMGQAGEGVALQGTLVSRSFRGTRIRAVVRCAQGPALTFDLPAGMDIPAAGCPIALTIHPQGVVCLAE